MEDAAEASNVRGQFHRKQEAVFMEQSPGSYYGRNKVISAFVVTGKDTEHSTKAVNQSETL